MRATAVSLRVPAEPRLLSGFFLHEKAILHALQMVKMWSETALAPRCLHHPIEKMIIVPFFERVHQRINFSISRGLTIFVGSFADNYFRFATMEKDPVPPHHKCRVPHPFGVFCRKGGRPQLQKCGMLPQAQTDSGWQNVNSTS
jgi:hypothetical protein